MIITFLKKIYAKLPEPGNWKFWVSISLVVKGLFFFLFIYLASSLPDDYAGFNYKGSFAKAGGDTEIAYLNPIENLILTGSYYDDLKMPGYGWLYFLFRLLFSQTLSINILIIFQLILSGLTVYLLAFSSYKIFKSSLIFYLTFFLYAFSIFVSVNDYVLMTESLAASTLIISFYYMLRFLEKNKKTSLFLSGCFLTWGVFLRPILIAVLLIYFAYICISMYFSSKKTKTIIITGLLFLSSFIIFDGLWILRNFKNHNLFIPLQRSVYGYGVENGYGGPMYDFVRAIGGDIEFWEPHSELIYFFPESRYFQSEMANDSSLALIPEYIYTSQFNKDSLINLRNKIIKLYTYSYNDANKVLLEKDIITQINSYIYFFKKEKLFHFYITTRIRSLSNFFIIRNNTWGLIWFEGFKNYYIGSAFKWFYTFFYYIIIIFGLIGVSSYFLLERERFNISNARFLLIAISLFLIFSHPVLLKSNPNRFLVTGFPFIIIYSAFVFEKIFTWLKLILKKKYKGF